MARITSGQIEMLKRFMTDSCFTCTDEWLLACVNWISEENNNPPFNLEFYKRELREQWQDANLTEMESACLPAGLAGQRLAKLTGKYGLQVIQIQDIGESSYNQYKKLKKLENENNLVAATDSNEVKPAWEPTPKRCFHLTMTDGSQEVFGIEKQHIPALNINLKPGAKIIIIGPIECRRGVMHLRPNNVRVIGGEVEQLVEENTLEKVLSRRLNITNLDSRPRSQAQTGPSNRNQRSTVQVTATPTTSTINSGNEGVIGEFPDSEGAFPDVSDFGDDDDLFMQIDESAIIQASETASSTGSTNTQLASANSSIFDKTTQRIGSVSNTPGNGDDIEDYEDDPNFVQPPPSRPGSSALGNSNTKASFAPPIKPPASASRSNAGSSKATTSKKTSFVPPPPPVKKVDASAWSASFQSAKSLSKSQKGGDSSRGTSSGTSGTGKQLNIMQYMKPMPVIIDPPTPERRAAKRRRTEEAKVEASLLQPRTAGPSSERNEADIVLDDDEDLFPNSPSDDALMQIIDETIESKLLECENPNNSNASTIPLQSTSTIAASSSVSVPQKIYPVKISQLPYVLVKQVMERIEELTESRKVFRVKACISTIIGSIKAENKRWVLFVSLNDGTGYLDCGISADILNRIVGFSPDEMKKIKAAKTLESKQKISQGLSNLAKTLIHTNAIFTVEMGPQPMIIEIIDVLHHHVVAVKKGLEEIGL